MRAWRAAIGAGLVFGSLALVFAAAEAALRVYHASKPKAGPEVIEPDARLGWRPKPNFHYTGTQRDEAGNTYPIEIQTNEAGFRYFGNTLSPRPKIFFVGDSVTYGREVTQDKHFVPLVGRALNAEVFALAAPGWGTYQEFLAFSEWVDTIGPDLVVWQFTENDFINNVWALEHRSAYHGFFVKKPYYQPNGQVIYRSPAQGAWMRAVGPWPSKLLQAVARRMDRMTTDEPLTLENTIERTIEAREGWHPAFEKSVELTEDVLRIATDRCGDAQLIVFNAHKFAPYDAALYDILDALRIPVVRSVEDSLAQAEAEGVAFRAEDRAHWTEPGHRICAEELVRYIKSHAVLSKAGMG